MFREVNEKLYPLFSIVTALSWTLIFRAMVSCAAFAEKRLIFRPRPALLKEVIEDLRISSVSYLRNLINAQFPRG